MNLRRGAAAAAMAGLLAARTAQAGPLDDPHVGGVAFVGPTQAGLASIYWNPAALGLEGGNHVALVGTGALTDVTVNRNPIDPSTGAPGGGFAPGSASG